MTDRKVIDLIRDLAGVCDDASIAAIINRLGYRTGAENTWTQSRVASLRHYQDIPVFDQAARKDWVTLEQAADELNASKHVVRRLLKEGILPGSQVVTHAPWIIKREDLDLPEVREFIEASSNGQKRPRSISPDSQNTLFQAH